MPRILPTLLFFILFLPTLVKARAPIVIWIEGDAYLHALRKDEPGSPRLHLYDELSSSRALRLEENAVVTLLSQGEEIITLKGEGRWILSPQGLTSLEGYSQSVQVIPGYKEPQSQWLSASKCPVREKAQELSINAPRSPVLMTSPRELRWSSHLPNDRFRIVLSEDKPRTSSLSAQAIETWSKVRGQSHPLYAELESGRHYRLTLAVQPQSPLGTPMGLIFTDRFFYLLEDSERHYVEKSLQALLSFQTDATRMQPELAVLKARFLESQGLFDEARKIWTKLLDSYPENEDLLDEWRRLEQK